MRAVQVYPRAASAITLSDRDTKLVAVWVMQIVTTLDPTLLDGFLLRNGLYNIETKLTPHGKDGARWELRFVPTPYWARSCSPFRFVVFTERDPAINSILITSVSCLAGELESDEGVSIVLESAVKTAVAGAQATKKK